MVSPYLRSFVVARINPLRWIGIGLLPKSGNTLSSAGGCSGDHNARILIGRNSNRRTRAVICFPAEVLRQTIWGCVKIHVVAPNAQFCTVAIGASAGIVAKAAEGYAKGSYFVVVDGIVGPWFIHPFRRLKQPLHYIVLRPALEAAIERFRLRGGDTLTDPEPISALHRQFSNLNEYENHVIRDGWA